ncbi:retrovirus-related pol polyprotein from transposon TNT 1-94 [Tanacetum coccineum]
MKVEESFNVTFNESLPPSKLSSLVYDDVGEEEAIENNIKVVNINNIKDESIEVDEVVKIKGNKLDENVIVSRNKARLVGQRYNQQEGIDYDETYASVARLESIRILLAIACENDFKLYQMDVKSTFLNGFINEEIYVDDIIFGSMCQNLCDDLTKIMHDEFEMSMMGDLKFFLGLQIKQMEDGIFFNQSKYIKEMLKKFRLEDSKPTKTPMSTEIKLTKDDEADSVDSTKYQGMIGSLLYLTASKLDIMFIVYLCASFQENHKTTHLEAIKRIFRYVCRTTHLGLWYPKGTDMETIVYANSDHATTLIERALVAFVHLWDVV